MAVETEQGAVLVCTTSGVAFGPVFDDNDEANEFLDYISHHYQGKDARMFDDHDLCIAQYKFREEVEAGTWPVEEEEEE